MTRRGAFTLIEVLVVVAIIGLLVAIAAPSISNARRISKRTYCLHNLHSIGIGIQTYLQTNNDKFPVLCKSKSAEAILNPTNPRPPISRGLAKELGNKSKVLECPADKVTKQPTDENNVPIPSAVRIGGRYFDVEETSYEWTTQANGLHRHTKKVIWNEISIPLKDLPLLNDFEPFHGPANGIRSINYLYADLRVESK